MAYDYESLRVEVTDGVCVATIDHPPVNLLDRRLFPDLVRFAEEVEHDDAVRVVVLQSALADFFIAHFDVELILGFPVDPEPQRSDEPDVFHVMCERFRTMPKATIGKIEGRVGGGGSELLLSLDMRFAARGRAVLSQPEVALGIIPGGTGTQRLHRLSGRSRALEIILGCEDFDADAAERYGWVNRALDDDEIGPFVDSLARRIASFPAHAVALAKQAIDAALPSPADGLLDEAWLFQRSLTYPEAHIRMNRFLAIGGQTPEVERSLGAAIGRLGA